MTQTVVHEFTDRTRLHVAPACTLESPGVFWQVVTTFQRWAFVSAISVVRRDSRSRTTDDLMFVVVVVLIGYGPTSPARRRGVLLAACRWGIGIMTPGYP
jgi:hypothetical protein